MIIEDMQQSLELLENIKYFFYDMEETEKKLSAELYNKEGERDDLLHEIELSKLNAIERMQIYAKLEKVLQEIVKQKAMFALFRTAPTGGKEQTEMLEKFAQKKIILDTYEMPKE